MSLPWFRYYAEDMEVDQVVDLSDLEYRAIVTLLHIAGQEELRGRLPDTRKVARRFVALGVRVSEGRTAQLLAMFRERGLLVEDPKGSGRLVPWNWEARQKVSDDGAARMKNFRQGKRAEHVPNEGRTRSAREPSRVTVFPSSSSSSSSSGTELKDAISLPGLGGLELEEEEESSSARVQHRLRTEHIAVPRQEEVDTALAESGVDCVLHCVDIACRNNKLSWAYIEATRRGHINDGCPEDITQTRRERMMAGRD